MKKISVVMFAVGMMALMSSMPAMAQWANMTFTTSSSFYAGDAKLPAGTYTIRQMQDDPNSYTLQNSAGTHTVLLERRQSSKASTGKTDILFNKYFTTDCLETLETSAGTSVDFPSPAAENLAARRALLECIVFQRDNSAG
jgi:hypothetical protein